MIIRFLDRVPTTVGHIKEVPIVPVKEIELVDQIFYCDTYIPRSKEDFVHEASYKLAELIMQKAYFEKTEEIGAVRYRLSLAILQDKEKVDLLNKLEALKTQLKVNEEKFNNLRAEAKSWKTSGKYLEKEFSSYKLKVMFIMFCLCCTTGILSGLLLRSLL